MLMIETKARDKQRSTRRWSLRRMVLALCLIVSIPAVLLGIVILPDLIRPVADPNPAKRIEELARVFESGGKASAVVENHGMSAPRPMLLDMPETSTLSNDELTTLCLLYSVSEDHLRWLIGLPEMAHGMTFVETWDTINERCRDLHKKENGYKNSIPPDLWTAYRKQTMPAMLSAQFPVFLAIDVDHKMWTMAAVRCAVTGQHDGEIYYLRKKGWVGRYWIARRSMTQRFGPKMEAFLTRMENHVVCNREPQAEPKYTDFLELRLQYDYADMNRKEREAIRKTGGN